MNNENSKNQAQLVIVSNRLPVVMEKKEGQLTFSPGSGGLVTALAPVLKNRGGLWYGWPGPVEGEEQELIKALNSSQQRAGYRFKPVFLTKEEVSLYYHGFSNEILWPLFHDLQSECNFVPEYWYAYQKVNAKFANAIMQNTNTDNFIWVHDYQLMLLGQELRKANINVRIGFFLHIPFPPLDIFIKLPWRFQIIRALLEYDLLGFQTMRDRRNFIQCARTLLKEISIKNEGAFHNCKIGQREVRVGAFPISIDYNDFARLADSKEVSEAAWYIHENLPNQKIVFSLDRLDYTKGIPYRLEAIRSFLKKYPDLHKTVTFYQVLIPSRVEIPKYQALKVEIDRLVGEINSEFTKDAWVPIQHIFRSLKKNELLAHYRTSEVALVTSLKDGMNLVSKEYIACNIEENGVLVLSEFAGAAAQMHKEALLINPYDIEGLAETLHTALTMPQDQRKLRMRKLRRNVRHYDVFWWVGAFLNAAFSKELPDFPILNEIFPDQPDITT